MLVIHSFTTQLWSRPVQQTSTKVELVVPASFWTGKNITKIHSRVNCLVLFPILCLVCWVLQKSFGVLVSADFLLPVFLLVPTISLRAGFLWWVCHEKTHETEEDFLRSGKWAETILSRLYGHSTWKWHESCGEWNGKPGDLVVNQIPSWERSHIPLKPSPFESMIFRTSRLVGYVIVPWRVCVLSLLLPENHGNFPYFWWDVGSLGVRVLKHYPNMNNMIGFCRSIWYGRNQDLDVFIW